MYALCTISDKPPDNLERQPYEAGIAVDSKLYGQCLQLISTSAAGAPRSSLFTGSAFTAWQSIRPLRDSPSRVEMRTTPNGPLCGAIVAGHTIAFLHNDLRQNTIHTRCLLSFCRAKDIAETRDC